MRGGDQGCEGRKVGQGGVGRSRKATARMASEQVLTDGGAKGEEPRSAHVSPGVAVRAPCARTLPEAR